MPRALSTAAKRAIYAAQTSEVALAILTISHPNMAETIRVVNNTVDVVSGGNTYVAYPFEIALPDEHDEHPSRAVLTIDNVDRQIIEGIRSITSPATLTLSIILASSPNTVEAGPFTFTLREVQYDALTVSGQLYYEDVLNEAFPEGTFTPNNFTGLF